MSLLEYIRTALIAASISGVSWPCLIGDCPDVDDYVISLQFYGGARGDTHLRENKIQLFQVRVRAPKGEHAQCEAKWNAILNFVETTAIANVAMILPLSTGPIFWLDDKGRPNMSLNCRATVTS